MGEGALRTERVKVRDECPEEAKEVHQHNPLTNYNAPCLRIRHACTKQPEPTKKWSHNGKAKPAIQAHLGKVSEKMEEKA